MERRWRIGYQSYYRTFAAQTVIASLVACAADCVGVNARSALFDLYGDHLRSRGGEAPVASLVQLLAALDITGAAVRTAVSRMVRQGWLLPVRLDQGRGYRLTTRAEHRLTEAASRIYRSGIGPWDHRWHLVVVAGINDRSSRDRIRSQMTYLGYAPMRDNVWVSPRESAEVADLLADANAEYRSFWAKHDGADASLAAAAWDLDGLARDYRQWLEDAKKLVGRPTDVPPDPEAFAIRSTLVHEWRKFLFRDPGLPTDLLPADWAGAEAAEFFDAQAQRLLPAARRYVDECLKPDTA